MGTVSRAAYTPTLVAENQTNMPDRADRTAIVGGTLITDIANISDPSTNWETRESQPVVPVNDHGAAYGSNYGDSFIFERIWVQPKAFPKGFITEDSDQYVRIWNASRFEEASVTDIIVQNQEGTEITYDPLPNNILVFSDINYLIEVFALGPPVQDTIYQFTVLGLDYEIPITGIRAINFDLDPNWDTGVKIQYTFQSTIFTSKKLNEQRRPLANDSWFSTSFKADAAINRANTNFHHLSYGKDKIFGVPVFLEKIEPLNCAQNEKIIYTNDDMTNMYNLNNRTDYVILVDHIHGLAEVKKMTSIAAGVINLDQPISADFRQPTTYIYPCMFCYLQSFRGTNITTNLAEISVNFEQYKS